MRARRTSSIRYATAVLVAWALAGCGGNEAAGIVVPGGDPERGARVIRAANCGSCHDIPGIRSADGVVGPPLIRFAHRSYIAGALPNSPDNLVRWIQDPHSVEPGTAMPDLALSEQQARDAAAYLYTLR